MISLSKKQHEYVLSIIDQDKQLYERIKESVSLNDSTYEYNMDDDLEIDFIDFLQDKQVEVGYDKDYKPNEDWEKIQEIMDMINNQ